MNKIKNTILIVDDEPQIRKLLRIIFEDEGYKVDECEDGKAAIRKGISGQHDLIILDLGLPGMDGKDVIQKIREVSQIPIIICSVRQGDQEIINTLNLGADDYLTKPFNPDIMVARVEAALRRNIVQDIGSAIVTNGQISMDLITHKTFLDQQEINLTPKEHELLKYFLKNTDRMIAHQQILGQVWGVANIEDIQYLRVYIKQLRKKIEPNPKSPAYIINVPGVGYRMPKISNE